MSQRQLPETLNFINQAERKVSLEGSWPVSRLDRLAASLNDTSGNIFARIKFGSKAGFNCLDGRVEASLNVICQRCIEPMNLEVSGHFVLALLTSEEELELVPDQLEPYMVEGAEQSLIDVIEDELLLSLPMVPVHEEECSEFLVKLEEQRQADKKAASPFSVLQGLKTEKS